MICKFCGAELADGTDVCPECGGVLSEFDTVVLESVPEKKPSKAGKVLGIVSFVLGLLSFLGGIVTCVAGVGGSLIGSLCSLGCCGSFLGLPTGILAAIFAIAGLVCGIVGVVLLAKKGGKKILAVLGIVFSVLGFLGVVLSVVLTLGAGALTVVGSVFMALLGGAAESL